MPDLRRSCFSGLTVAALLLAACSEDVRAPDEPMSQNASLVRLVEDARYEVREGNLAEAGRLYDEALAIERDNAALWVDIARLRFRGGEHAGAVEAADYALSLDPNHAPALLLRAQLVRDAYGMGESLPWFERALAQHPDDEELLAAYAATLGDLGRHRDMLATVRRLAEINPRNPQVHYLQAVLAARAGDPVTASSLLKRSGLRDAGVPSAVLLGALIDMQQGNYDNAATALEQLLVRQAGNARVADLLARALWLKGRDDEIVDRFYDRAIAADASPYLVMLVGRSLERLGRRAEAVPFLNRAAQVELGKLVLLPGANENPRALPGQTLNMRRLVSSAQRGQSRRYAAALVSEFPQSSDIKVLAGDAALAQGDEELALTRYTAAAEVRRPWPLTKKIIYAYRAMRDEDAADALLLRHLKTELRNPEALIMLAQRSAADEDWLRVAVLLDTAISLGVGNDLVLLELRRDAAIALDDVETAERLETSLAQLRPPKFVND
ncbi:lipopolysaccharide assembly protein LapB [Erythrobacter sp. THAF29]|uniref:tetratricopeptide repeat protein n=1 Tax=Erythrobacter sp. THAF29 TaxID=2587851 RepID=UPI0012AA68A4|nr:tetratricopeptide repeat protein [Erythrobacter sp. THAF29]QFT77734.1 tetratricopeptide repeat protein [Erythrobacter sp. THAF29]